MTEAISDLQAARQQRRDERLAEYREAVTAMVEGRTVTVEAIDGLLKDLGLSDSDLAGDVEDLTEYRELRAASAAFKKAEPELREELDRAREERKAAHQNVRTADRKHIEAVQRCNQAGRPWRAEETRQKRLEALAGNARLFASVGPERAA